MREKLKKYSSTPIIFITLMALTLVCIVWRVYDNLDNGQKEIKKDLATIANNSASGPVGLVSVWYGSTFGQLELLKNDEKLKSYIRNAGNMPVAEQSSQPEAAHPDDSLNALLAREKDEAQKALDDFVSRDTRFLEAALVVRNGQKFHIVLGETSITELDEKQKMLLTAAKEGEMLLLPVRRSGSRKTLVVDVAIPIFQAAAPSAAPASGEQNNNDTKNEFYLLCTCDITHLSRGAISKDNDNMFTSGLLEKKDDSYLLLVPDLPDACGYPVEAPQHKQDAAGDILMEEINVPTHYSNMAKPALALIRPVNVKNELDRSEKTTWYVLQSISRKDFDERYATWKHRVIAYGALAAALAAILLVALWWWLVGRRERAVANDMRELYQMVSDQKQILDGVNASLSAGVVLNDLSGTIYYVNPSYAHMAGMDPHHMHGLSYKDLPIDLARSLASHTNTVDASGEMATFTEEFEISGQRHHFLTKSSPFLDADNNLVGIVSVYSDVSDLVAAQTRAQRMVTQTVAVFLRTIEAHDPYLGGHSFLTAELAVVLAYCLGVNDEETMDTLRTAASLSQIGMIHLPRQLLLKTGTLTPEERQFMQRHVQYAAAALEGIDFGLPVLPAIVQMYERLDGSGYPRRLSGDQICFHARILAVANTFVALMRPRSYRSPHSIESALSILNTRPAKYDPQIVHALRDYLETENGQAFMVKLRNRQDAQKAKQKAKQSQAQPQLAQAQTRPAATAAAPAQPQQQDG